jgi:small-conductance mechanosensitive channel
MTLNKLFIPIMVALSLSVILLIIRGIALKLLYRWAENTETSLYDIVIKSLKNPSIYWCVAVGLYVGVRVSELPEKYVVHMSTAINIIIIFSITIAAANLVGRIFKNYIQQSELPVPTTGLAYGIIKGSIFVMGFMIILSVLGISITPLITALGVGGIAVALALKDTLENLFSGIHILMENSVRIGDFIRLDSGLEGYISDITWRTTRIKMLNNNMVIIPNSKLSQSIVTNYNLPDKSMAVIVPISISYNSDTDKVELILAEVAENAVKELPGLFKEHKPIIRLSGFGQSSIDFLVIVFIHEVVEQYTAQHEIRKRILKRFRQEGVEIPYQQSVVHLKREA